MSFISNYKIIDTNILLDFPNVLDESNIVISTDVLRELDGLKLNINSEVSLRARRAAILISKNISGIKFDSSMEKENYSTDDKLIELTKSYAGELITNDVYCKLKAISKGVRTSGYGSPSNYIGVYYWDVDVDEQQYSPELEAAINEGIAPERFDFKENEYLIASIDGKVVSTLVYRQGKLSSVTSRAIRNRWIKKITPRNPEQICLFEALSNKDITVLYAGGPQGVGKSYLLNNYALQQLQEGEIEKIVYVPNNAYVKNSMELGFLPGSSFEKLTPLIGPLVDLIGIDEVTRLMSADQLEIIPIGYMRGRNLDNTIILINEAQNLDSDHIKLLIGRVGNNSRIFFDGSLQQIDGDVFKNRNGLRSLIQLADSPYNENFATVRLKKIERSKTAQIADYLDSLE